MKLGQVVGTVVASRKSSKLDGFKLLAVRGVDPTGQPEKDYVIAVDAVGAGPGEIVLTVTGSSAREDQKTRSAATDTTIVSIVDRIVLGSA